MHSPNFNTNDCKKLQYENENSKCTLGKPWQNTLEVAEYESTTLRIEMALKTSIESY